MREELNTVIIAVAVASATVMSQGSLITVCSLELERGAGEVLWLIRSLRVSPVCAREVDVMGFSGARV